MYEYKMIQIPPNVAVEMKRHKGNEAAAYMEQVVNEYAQQGWEFYRVDPVGVSLSPGCLASLFGQKEQQVQYHVITFRKQS